MASWKYVVNEWRKSRQYPWLSMYGSMPGKMRSIALPLHRAQPICHQQPTGNMPVFRGNEALAKKREPSLTREWPLVTFLLSRVKCGPVHGQGRRVGGRFEGNNAWRASA